MKTITIGRGSGCTIIVDDELISRCHAIIKIPIWGKMEIIDMSKNGTFVNGVRLRPNVPFPVTRKDVVNCANIYQLEWADVPNPTKWYKWGGMLLVGIIMLILVICMLQKCQPETPPTPPGIPNPTDSEKKQDTDTMKGKEYGPINVFEEARANRKKQDEIEQRNKQEQKQNQTKKDSASNGTSAAQSSMNEEDTTSSSPQHSKPVIY